MFEDDNTVAYGNDALFAADEQLALRKARLLAAAKEAAAGTGNYAPAEAGPQGSSFRSAVTGAEILGKQPKLGLLAAAAPLGQMVADNFAQRGYQDDMSGYKRQEKVAADAHMAKMPAPGAPEAEKIAWAQAGTRIPILAPTMKAYFEDQVIKAPERAELREERKMTRMEARVEAQRKQEEDLAYKRERDKDAADLRRDLAAQANDLRASLHAAVRASGAAGGDKASDYQIIQGDNGEVFRVGKRPGSAVERVDSATGKSSGTNQKDVLDTRDAIERSTLAISEAPRAKELLEAGSSSGIRADIRRAGSYVAPSMFGGKAAEADEALKSVSDTYVKSVPRFSGPTSDGDRKDYAAAAGQLANTNLPPATRSAALDEVVRLHKKALVQQQQRGNQPTSPKAPTPPAASPSKPPASSVSDDDLVRMYSKPR